MTQGVPLIMAMYGVAIIPLIEPVSTDNVTHKWYADDGNAVGSLKALQNLLLNLKAKGLAFGYNVIECHLITKTENITLFSPNF